MELIRRSGNVCPVLDAPSHVFVVLRYRHAESVVLVLVSFPNAGAAET
jgi:hypothetical protein